jgi:hypothetical protein
MFGILLASLATLIGEAGSSIGKDEVHKRRETVTEMAIINGLFGLSILAVIAFFFPPSTYLGNIFGGFVFSVDSLPYFIPRFLLEILVVYLFTNGAAIATRATFSFLRMVTIPLLLIVDIALGYVFTYIEIIGIIVIFLTTSSLFFSKTLKREGMWYILGGSVTAVATVSLYQYNITNFNSVAGEQIVMYTGILIYLIVLNFYQTRKNPFRHFKRPKVAIQSICSGSESVITSFAFLFAPASIIMAARRTSAILWAIVVGNRVFHEQHIGAKLAGLGVLSACLLVLASFG